MYASIMLMGLGSYVKKGGEFDLFPLITLIALSSLIWPFTITYLLSNKPWTNSNTHIYCHIFR